MGSVSEGQAGGGPVAIEATSLAEATCRTCLATVWAWDDDGALDQSPMILDRAWFRGAELLSLHPCAHDLRPEDLDDPDWGWLTD